MIEERDLIHILSDAQRRGLGTEKLAFLMERVWNGGGELTPETAEKVRKIITGVADKEGDGKPKERANGPDATDPSIFVTIGDLLDVEEVSPPDLWEGEIRHGSLVGLSGMWGSMKTYIMQALGIRAAQGQPFLGRRLQAIDVFIFDRENPRSVWKRRLVDLAGQDRPERFHMMTLFGPFIPPAFDIPGVAFYNWLAELHPGSLFIFDSLVRYYPSGKQTENTEDAIHAMTVLKALTRWVTVIFLHHPTKAGSDFRGGGDLQAAPDLLYALTHDKGAKRLTLECVKNRYEEAHTIQIEYRPTLDGGLCFVDVANAEELKRRAEDQQREAAILRIIEELHAKGESTKRRLLEEGKKRLGLSRRILEPLIDNGVGRTWSVQKLVQKHLYGPLCTDDLFTPETPTVEKRSDDKGNECVQDDEHTAVYGEHGPDVSVHSVLTHSRSEHTYTPGHTNRNSEGFEEQDRWEH